VQRSRPQGEQPSAVVALWKDPTRGLREISLGGGEQGVLISMAATRARRRCADGRTPLDNSAGLVVAGLHGVTAVPPEAVRTGSVTTVSRSALDGVDLTIVTAWADVLADALEHSPAAVDDLLAEARAGAAWRAQLGLPEPTVSLARALAAVADAVAATDAGRDRDAAVLEVLRHDSPDGDGAVSLGRSVLRAALEARLDVRAAVPQKH
jgi:hypothetical protein